MNSKQDTIIAQIKKKLNSKVLAIQILGLKQLFKQLTSGSNNADNHADKNAKSLQETLKDMLLNVITRSHYSSYTCSLAVEYTFLLVNDSKLNWEESVLCLCQALEIVDVSKLDVLVRALFRIWDIKLEKQFTNWSKKAKDLNDFNTWIPEPVITKAFQRFLDACLKNLQLCWRPIITALRSNLKHKNVFLLLYLRPLLTQLLIQESSEQARFLLLALLVDSIDASPATPLIDQQYCQNILFFLISSLKQYPKTQLGPRFEHLNFIINWLLTHDSLVSLFLSETFIAHIIQGLLIILINLLCEGVSERYDLVPILQNIRQLTLKFGYHLPELLTLSLAYVLYSPNTVDESLLALDILNHPCISNTAYVIQCALFYPLIRLSFQSILIEQSKACAKLLQFLNLFSKSLHNREEQTLYDHAIALTTGILSIQNELDKSVCIFRIEGVASLLLQDFAMLIKCYICNEPNIMLKQILSTHHSFPSSLSPLWIGALTLSSIEEIRIQATQRLIEQTDFKNESIYLLALLMTLLKVPAYPKHTIYILYKGLPHLTKTSDPLVPSRIFRIVQSLCGSSDEWQKVTLISSSSLRMFFHIYRTNSICWAPFRHLLSSWIQSKKSMAVNPNHEPNSIDTLEIAAMSTICDVCAFNPQQAGHDLFPLISSLIQYTRLHPMTLSLAIAAINSIVSEGVIEILPIWDLLISNIANQTSKSDHFAINVELCRFYSQLVLKKHDSETHHQRLQRILNEYVLKLIFPLQDEQIPDQVRDAALSTLSHYRIPSIVQVLPSPPIKLIDQILENEKSAPSWVPVLQKLLNNEIEHMGRANFKGQPQKDIDDSASQSINLIKRSLETYAQQCSSKIDHSVAGIKSATTLARIIAFFACVSPDRKSLAWRILRSSLADLTLGDDLPFRMLVFPAWVNFLSVAVTEPVSDEDYVAFEEAVVDTDMIKHIFQELTQTYLSSEVPVIVINSIFCLCALPYALNRLSQNMLATSYGIQAAQTILKQIDLSIAAPHLVHNDVLFAAAIGLSSLTRIISQETEMIVEIIRFLEHGLDDLEERSSEWFGFASNLGLGYVFDALCELNPNASMTTVSEDRIELLGLIEQIMVQRYNNFESVVSKESLSFLGFLGIFYGRLHISIVRFTQKQFKLQVQSNNELDIAPYDLLMGIVKELEDGVKEGASHISHRKHVLIAYAQALPIFGPLLSFLIKDKETRKNAQLRIINVLQKACDKFSQPQLSSLQSHMNMALGNFLHSSVAQKPSPKIIALYYNTMNKCLDKLGTGTATTLNSSTRMSTVLCLASLMGAECIGYTPCIPYAIHADANFQNMKKGIEILMKFSGVGSNKTALIQDFRLARVITAMLAQLAHLSLVPIAHHSIVSKLFATEQSNKNILTTTSSEPLDYSRFPKSTSYIRAIYEGLQQAQGSSKIDLSIYFLQSLTSIEYPLPPVNWFQLLLTIRARCEPKAKEAIPLTLLYKFAIKHCKYSVSLAEFLVCEIDRFERNLSSNSMALNIFTNEGALDALLSLMGFQLSKRKNQPILKGSWSTILKPALISTSKLSSSLQDFIKALIYCESDEIDMECVVRLLQLIKQSINGLPEEEVIRTECIKFINNMQQWAQDQFYQYGTRDLNKRKIKVLNALIQVSNMSEAVEKHVANLSKDKAKLLLYSISSEPNKQKQKQKQVNDLILQQFHEHYMDHYKQYKRSEIKNENQNQAEQQKGMDKELKTNQETIELLLLLQTMLNQSKTEWWIKVMNIMMMEIEELGSKQQPTNSLAAKFILFGLNAISILVHALYVTKSKLVFDLPYYYDSNSLSSHFNLSLIFSSPYVLSASLSSDDVKGQVKTRLEKLSEYAQKTFISKNTKRISISNNGAGDSELINQNSCANIEDEGTLALMCLDIWLKWF